MGAALRGLVLDLRGNPGGLLDQSVEVASLFLDGAPVISTIGRVPESIQYFAAPHRDGRDAAAGGAGQRRLGLGLGDRRRGAAGRRPRGRRRHLVLRQGHGAERAALPNDGELTVTWARLITPGGYILHQHGVVPTVCTAQSAG